MRVLGRKLATRLPDDDGQSMIIVVLGLGLFLLGAIAFGTDIANLWFHRQSSQTAADAACTAGVMDILYQAEGESSYSWVTNQTTDCNGVSSGATAIAPCWYAAKNGYGGADYSGGTASVALSYPTSNGNVPTCTSSSTTFPCATSLFQVNIRDRTGVIFAALLNGGNTTMDVGAQATCAVMETLSPIPLLVLDPHDPALNGNKNGSALSVQGTPTVSIYGGPTQSIQVNDADSNAFNLGGSGSVNLSLGGPNTTGSNFGVTGGPTSNPGVTLGTTGTYVSPHSPISDPFASLAAPSQPATSWTGPYQSIKAACVLNPNAANCPLNPGSSANGCPDSTHGCDEYAPGYYANGISIQNATAIFDPGIYYLAGGSSGGFTAVANSCLRPSTYDSQSSGIGGMMLYLSGSGTTVSVASNAGSYCTKYATAFNTSTGSGVLANGVKCTASSTTPSNLPATLTGNVMLAPCTGTYGDPLMAIGQTDPLGEQRGMLIFQDRSVTNINSQTTGPSWGGSGSFLLDGTMYFHSCNSSGTGQGCGATPTYWSDFFSLQGSSGSSTWVLGDIVADNLVLGGSSTITMDLNPASAFEVLKASLIQ